MGIFRPATPGFLVTLTATALLAAVSFNVPILKSTYFLRATVDSGNINTSVTFGTLGYCTVFQGNTTCSKPSVGYELDINSLVGDNLPIQIPQVLVKWVTYALVLHIVALILAAISSVFGLLAHVREMSMAYCSTCVSGFAASVALIAFIFDLVLFFLTKSRINNVNGGHADIGTSLWLTLAAWVLLFFAGCFYGLGRCCVRRRPRNRDREGPPDTAPMRMDAFNADPRTQKDGGLPAFPQHEHVPLKSDQDQEEPSSDFMDIGDEVVPLPNQLSAATSGRNQPRYAGGYAEVAPGTRTVDAYYNTPPQQVPTSQPSMNTGTTPSVYSDYRAPSTVSTAVAPDGGYLNAYNGHQQQPSGASVAYGRVARGTSVSRQDTANYGPTNNDSFTAGLPQPAFNADSYNSGGYIASDTSYNPYRAGPEYRNNTSMATGGGYGSNAVPGLNQSMAYPQYHDAEHGTHEFNQPPSYRYGSGSPLPSTSTYPSVQSAVAPPMLQMPQSLQGPRNPMTPSNVMSAPLTDSPPTYETLDARPPGVWGEKGQR